MIAPAVSQITTKFSITNEVEASMIVSIFGSFILLLSDVAIYPACD